MKSNQRDLFNEPVKEEWEREWKDMPEFVQEDKTAFKQILVNFRNEEDLKKFGELVNQKITISTKSIYFPQHDKEKPNNYLYTYIKKENES